MEYYMYVLFTLLSGVSFLLGFVIGRENGIDKSVEIMSDKFNEYTKSLQSGNYTPIKTRSDPPPPPPSSD